MRWPDTSNRRFIEALAVCEAGGSPNNISAVIRYSVESGASFLWLGDLETGFMEEITESINLPKTTIVFAAHHGRYSGKIPNAWLEKLDPQIIVIGEAPSRDLHYYTGYARLTQNRATYLAAGLDDYLAKPFERTDLAGLIARWLPNEISTSVGAV